MDWHNCGCSNTDVSLIDCICLYIRKINKAYNESRTKEKVMDEVLEVEIEEKPKLIDQIAKFVFATVAMFAATQLVEKTYDKLIIERRKDYIKEPEEQ